MSWFAILFSLGDIINFYNQFPSLDGIILVSDEASCAWLQAMPVSLHRLQCPLSDFSSAADLCHHQTGPSPSDALSTRHVGGGLGLDCRVHCRLCRQRIQFCSLLDEATISFHFLHQLFSHDALATFCSCSPFGIICFISLVPFIFLSLPTC